MEHRGNSTATPHQLRVRPQSAAGPAGEQSGEKASLYILIVMSFYGVFLCGVMLGYFQSKRRERRRTNVFTRLVHEEEQREWGALPKKHSLQGSPGGAPPSGQVALPFIHSSPVGHVYYEGALTCTHSAEQNCSSPLCASTDTRVTIEEESDGSEEVAREESDDSR